MRGAIVCVGLSCCIALVAEPTFSPGARSEILVATANETQDQAAIAATDSGFAVAWRDNQDKFTTAYDIYAQAFDWRGRALWSRPIGSGIPVARTAGWQDQPAISIGPDGLTWIAWRDLGGCASGQIRVQAYGSDGEAVLGDDGAAVHDCHTGQLPALQASSKGSAIIFFSDVHGEWSYLRAQKILSADGSREWGTEGVVLDSIPDGGAAALSATTMPDGAGGAIAVWNRSGSLQAQRVDAAGSLVWGGAVLVTTWAGPQNAPGLAPDELGGVLIVWEHGAEDSKHIRGQRIDQAGATHWGPSGKVIAEGTGDFITPQIARSTMGRSFVVWEDFRAQTISNLLGTRIDLLGDTLSARAFVCDEFGRQSKPRLASASDGSVFVAWQDGRSVLFAGGEDIYGQRLGADGSPLCTTNGEPLAAYLPSNQRDPLLVSTVSGGSDTEPPAARAVVLWSEGRNGLALTDLYAAPFAEDCRPGVVDVGEGFALDVGLSLEGTPNPSGREVRLAFRLPRASEVVLQLYDLRGRRVRTLLSREALEAGPHSLSWDLRDDSGGRVVPGAYFAEVTAGGATGQKRLIVLH